MPAFPAYADASEKTVSRKPLGSMTSNARLFHSVSRGSDLSVMPAFFARFAISSTLPGVVEMDNRTPIPFLRSRPFFQSSWLKPIWVLPARSITPHEPATLATAAAVLVAAGLLASYWPARAATRIEPTVALRAE